MKNLFKLHGIFFISYFFPTFPFPAVCSDNHVKFHFLHFRMLIGVNTSLSWEICKMLIFWVKFQSCCHFKGKNHANVYKQVEQDSSESIFLLSSKDLLLPAVLRYVCEDLLLPSKSFISLGPAVVHPDDICGKI